MATKKLKLPILKMGKIKVNSKPCQELADTVARLQAEQSEIVERYERLGREPSGKDAQRLRTLTSEIADKQEKLRQCLAANPPPPPAPPVKTIYTATVQFRIQNENTPDPINVPLTVGLTFSGATPGGGARIVTVNSFPPIVMTLDTPLGQDILTISKEFSGFGTFIPSSGSLFLDIKLLFDHSIGSFTDSHLPLNLTTGSVLSPIQNQMISGSPLAANGQLSLVGVSTFVDVNNSGISVLGGNVATAQIIGTIAPIP